jgi:two-component system sensor histidine kinase SenX3
MSMIFKTRSGRGKDQSPVHDFSPREKLPLEVIDLLQLFDAESLILNSQDTVIYQSAGISHLGIIRDARLSHEALLMLVRTARRGTESVETTLELPRGPIGGGTHELFVRLGKIGTSGNISVLIFDESEMRRLDSVRRDFVANISHELKTPIGALSILSEAVLEASDDPEAIARFATRMQSESKRLTDLVQEIINLSRLQDDDPLKRGEEVSLHAVISDAIDETKTMAEKRNISIEFGGSGSEQNLTVFGDRFQLTVAVHNLIENAINYSPDQTRVAIALNRNQDLSEITVSDQGIGIPEKDIERIFERFYRVDPARSRETGGTGLGLSIVKHIVGNHGGDLTVWSKENSGSTFTIRLPINAANSNEVSTLSSTHQGEQ